MAISASCFLEEEEDDRGFCVLTYKTLSLFTSIVTYAIEREARQQKSVRSTASVRMLFRSGHFCRLETDYLRLSEQTYTNVQRSACMRVKANNSNLVRFMSLQGMANKFVKLWVTTITGKKIKSNQICQSLEKL